LSNLCYESEDSPVIYNEAFYVDPSTWTVPSSRYFVNEEEQVISKKDQPIEALFNTIMANEYDSCYINDNPCPFTLIEFQQSNEDQIEENDIINFP
ncbi:MAG: hypothetical protein QF362_01785, partial [Candidatus Woesearchaeota archaeon]|nr:hypothetical protein [Candidatus Woesearchaeota archaeon]